MRLVIAAWLIALALSAPPAHADPISGLIVTGLFGSAFAGSTVGGIVTGVVTLGLSVGISTLANSLFGSSQPSPTPQTVQNTIRQSIPPRWRHYGRQKIGGAMVCIESKGGDLHQVIAFANHKIHTINEFRIDNRPCTTDSIDGDGWVTLTDYPASTVRLLYRMGEASQAYYPELTDALGSDIWSEDHRGDGIAHAYILQKGVPLEIFNSTYPNKVALLQMICEGAEVYDPALEGVFFTTNLALHMRDYLVHDDGCAIPESDVDDDLMVIAKADADTLLPKKGGGTIQRYNGALSYSLDAERSSVIKRLLTATDGDLRLLPSGKIGFTCGVWRTPTVHITDADIIDWEASDGAGPLQESNEIRLKYTEPLADFAAGEAQAWRDETDISASGQVRTQTIEAYEIQHHNHARRIQKIAAHRAAPRWQGTIRTTLKGMEAWDQRWIYLTNSDIDIVAQTFEVRGISLDVATMTVVLKIAAFGPEAYEFDAETEEGTAPSVPIEVVDDGIPEPEGVEATSVARQTSGGDAIMVLQLHWDEPTRRDLRAEAQYAIADSENWQAMAVTREAYMAESGGVDPTLLYDARVRHLGSAGGESPWVLVEDIVITGEGAPAVLQVLIADAEEVAGDIRVSWRAPNDPIYRGARIYVGTSASFGSAEPITPDIYGSANGNYSHDVSGLLPEDYFVWVAAINAAGSPTLPAADAGVVTIP